MSSKRNRAFSKSVKGKVLLGFFVAAIALGSSWIISKIAFENMLEKLEVLSTPSEKLRIVNKVFKDILQLDQLQNARPLPEKEDSDKTTVSESVGATYQHPGYTKFLLS